MKLTEIAFRPYRINLKSSWESSIEKRDFINGIIIRITLKKELLSVVGYGEIPQTVNFTPAVLRDLIRTYSSLADIRKYARDHKIPGTYFTGVDCALLDAEARLKDIPMGVLLNIRWNPVLTVNAVTSTRFLNSKCRSWREYFRDYPCIKVKIGLLSPGEEIDLIKELRRQLGSSVLIRLDANRKWDFETALTFLNSLGDVNPEYVEEPLISENRNMLAELYGLTGIPLALDETCADFSLCKSMIASGGVQVIICKPGRDGGLSASLKKIRFFQSEGLKTVITSMLESGLGVTAVSHLCGALYMPDTPFGLDTMRYLEDTLLLDPPGIAKGRFYVPQKPGIGIRLNEDSPCWTDKWHIL